MRTKILVATFQLNANETKIIPFNFGLDYEMRITEMTSYSSGDYTFNLRLLGSPEWIATEKMRKSAVFLGYIPFRFPVEFVIPLRGGIEIDATNLTASTNSIQIVFIGYAL
jgi:hypothetical protein